jgi:hypothetical protein
MGAIIFLPTLLVSRLPAWSGVTAVFGAASWCLVPVGVWAIGRLYGESWLPGRQLIRACILLPVAGAILVFVDWWLGGWLRNLWGIFFSESLSNSLAAGVLGAGAGWLTTVYVFACVQEKAPTVSLAVGAASAVGFFCAGGAAAAMVEPAFIARPLVGAALGFGCGKALASAPPAPHPYLTKGIALVGLPLVLLTAVAPLYWGDGTAADPLQGDWVLCLDANVAETDIWTKSGLLGKYKQNGTHAYTLHFWAIENSVLPDRNPIQLGDTEHEWVLHRTSPNPQPDESWPMDPPPPKPRDPLSGCWRLAFPLTFSNGEVRFADEQFGTYALQDEGSYRITLTEIDLAVELATDRSRLIHAAWGDRQPVGVRVNVVKRDTSPGPGGSGPPVEAGPFSAPGSFANTRWRGYLRGEKGSFECILDIRTEISAVIQGYQTIPKANTVLRISGFVSDDRTQIEFTANEKVCGGTVTLPCEHSAKLKQSAMLGNWSTADSSGQFELGYEGEAQVADVERIIKAAREARSRDEAAARRPQVRGIVREYNAAYKTVKIDLGERNGVSPGDDLEIELLRFGKAKRKAYVENVYLGYSVARLLGTDSRLPSYGDPVNVFVKNEPTSSFKPRYPPGRRRGPGAPTARGS